MQLFVASVLLLASGACANFARFGNIYQDAVPVASLNGASLGRWYSADEAAMAGDWSGLKLSSRHIPLRSKLVSPASFRFATPEALAVDAAVADDFVTENNVVLAKSPFAFTGAEAAWRKAGAIPITTSAAEAFANRAVADEFTIVAPEAGKYETIIPADAAVVRSALSSHALAGAPALRHTGLLARAFPSIAAHGLLPTYKNSLFGAAEPSVFLKSLNGAELIPTATRNLAAHAQFPAAAKLFADAPFVAEESPARFVKAFEGAEEAALPGSVLFASRFQHMPATAEAFKYKLVPVSSGIRSFITPALTAAVPESAARFAEEAAFPAGAMHLKHAIATPFF